MLMFEHLLVHVCIKHLLTFQSFLFVRVSLAFMSCKLLALRV